MFINLHPSFFLFVYQTTADDIHGMKAAVGILTEHGGMTSHAAVVGRGMFLYACMHVYMRGNTYGGFNDQ